LIYAETLVREGISCSCRAKRTVACWGDVQPSLLPAQNTQQYRELYSGQTIMLLGRWLDYRSLPENEAPQKYADTARQSHM